MDKCKRIEAGNWKIEYVLKRNKRSQGMRLVVCCGGGVVVTAPFWVKQSFIEKFIGLKAKWIVEKIEYFSRFSEFVFIGGSKRDYLKHKKDALIFVQDRVEYFSKIYGFKYNRVSVKNQKTRWGSCSTKKNLNFNYKITLIDKQVADYIIVHELCHLKQLNHSKNFWKLVKQILPNYLESRKKLKKN